MGGDELRLELRRARAVTRWVGWGTSLAWWGNALGRWSPDGPRRGLMRRLFDPIDGLGLSVVRYNIGGGENPGHHHMRLHGDIPGWLDEAGRWSVDADRYQLDILGEAIGLGVGTVEAFSNAPPYWMTRHPCAAGSPDGSPNLERARLPDFADYLVEAARSLDERLPPGLASLSPANEPSSAWWKAKNNQEGCAFGRLDLAELYRQVRSRLDAAGLSGILVAGPEENDLDEGLATLVAFEASGLTARGSALGRINVHSYRGSLRRDLRSFAAARSLPLWMSEVSIGGDEPHDHGGWSAAAELARVVCRDIAELAPEAWVYWQAVEDEAGRHNHGLIHADFNGPESWWTTRQYHVMAQFSTFIRPGAYLVETSAPGAVAAWDPRSGEVVLVVANEGGKGLSLVIEGDLSPTSGLPSRLTDCRRTSPSEEFAQVEPALSAAARSVTSWRWRL